MQEFTIVKFSWLGGPAISGITLQRVMYICVEFCYPTRVYVPKLL